jgi:methanogenic corrinoid protein MtbC1
VKDLMRCLKDDGTRARVIVGGAPFRIDRELREIVGADGTGMNAADAVKIAQSWLSTPDAVARCR